MFAYEPEPLNFSCLTHNLEPFRDKVVANKVALSNETGIAAFYLNPEHTGNFSLSPDAVPTDHSKISVDARDVAVESAAWMEGGRRIFYKSDTEGFDEVVASRIKREVWPHIFAGIIEILSVKKPSFDETTFRAFLDTVPNKVFLGNPKQIPETPASTADVLSHQAQ